MSDPNTVPRSCAAKDRPRFYDLGYRIFYTAEECNELLEVASRHGVQAPSRIVDIGCGPGHHLREFARRGIDSYGIDSDNAMLAYAHRLAMNDGSCVSWLLADMRQFQLNLSADVALCVGASFNSLTTEAEAAAALQSIATTLHPGGLIILELHHPPSVYGRNLVARWRVSHLAGVADCTFSMSPRSEPAGTYLWDTVIDLHHRDGSITERALFRTEARPWYRRDIERLTGTHGSLELVGWHLMKVPGRARYILAALRRTPAPIT
jgi:SAM-dependent methyltransferase